MVKISKNEKSKFFDNDVPKGPESVPTTMIWISEPDSAAKKPIATALAGATFQRDRL